MTPSTLVRSRPRLPLSFIARVAVALEGIERPAPKPLPKCVVLLDDGRPCGLPGRYLDFNRGGHVCLEHRPNRKQEALCLK